MTAGQLGTPKHRNTRPLWSLWDMLTLDAKTFVSLFHNLIATELEVRGKKGHLPLGVKMTLVTGAQNIANELRALDLPHSVQVTEQMLSNCQSTDDLHRGIEQLINSLALELNGRKFYGPLRKYEQYFEQPKLFGDEVFTKFSSANNDIFEAGTCLALERGTACVMHLMRVVEAGLKALAKALGVGVQNDWGAYLREVDGELGKRIKASGKRTADEQFYAEARVTIDGIRIAWRNPTMHIENNYSPERAEGMLIAVRSLMQHLATRLSEWSALP
jgi:hypothetical protein